MILSWIDCKIGYLSLLCLVFLTNSLMILTNNINDDEYDDADTKVT